MIIADASADPRYIAADLLAQAEHGSGMSVSTLHSRKKQCSLKCRMQSNVSRPVLLTGLPFKRFLKNNFAVFIGDLDFAIEAANIIAPEHLELQVKDSEIDRLSQSIITAGSILQGHNSPTVLGDFTAGPSHTPANWLFRTFFQRTACH